MKKQAISTCYCIVTSKLYSKLINTIKQLLNERAVETIILLTFLFQG
jgi:hypothetical protein